MSTTSVSHPNTLNPLREFTDKPHYAKSSTKAIKLLRFFGDTPPMDVSIKEIKKHGLKAMLQSKLPLCYFMHALLDEYAAENLFFVLEVDRYQATPFTNLQSHIHAAYAIFHTYLSPNASCLEINIDHKIRQTLIQKLNHLKEQPVKNNHISIQLRNLFEQCKTSVIQNLDMSYNQFTRSSPLYTKMVKELIPAPTSSEFGMQVYVPEAKQAAVRLLAQYLITHQLTETHSPEIEDMLNRPNFMVNSSQPQTKPNLDEHIYLINAYIQDASAAGQHTNDLLRGNRRASQSPMTLLDPSVNRAILRRMIQGFAITMLNVDLIQFAMELDLESC